MEEDAKTYNSSGSGTIVLPQHMVEEKKEEFLKTLIERYDMKSAVALFEKDDGGLRVPFLLYEGIQLL